MSWADWIETWVVVVGVVVKLWIWTIILDTYNVSFGVESCCRARTKWQRYDTKSTYSWNCGVEFWLKFAKCNPERSRIEIMRAFSYHQFWLFHFIHSGHSTHTHMHRFYRKTNFQPKFFIKFMFDFTILNIWYIPLHKIVVFFTSKCFCFFLLNIMECGLQYYCVKTKIDAAIECAHTQVMQLWQK